MAVGCCAEKLYEQVYHSPICGFFPEVNARLEAHLPRPGSLDGKAHDVRDVDSGMWDN